MISALSVEASPREVDAGADLTLKATVVCSPAADLRGETLLIIDPHGALVQSVELGEFDGETNETREFVIEAPMRAGAHTWLAVLPVGGTEGAPHEETSAPFSFEVKPHRTDVVVWDVPPTVEAGEPFRMKLGVKCSAGCRPEGWTVEVRDQDGVRQASPKVGSEPWPGTTGLHFAEVELSAPGPVGLHEWAAEARVDGLDVPHAECVRAFGVRAVPAPECLVTVVATDLASGEPVEGARVVAHPYEAVTDEAGHAEVRLPRGEYRLFVSGRKHTPFRREIEVEDDVTIQAELALEAELTDAEIWA